MFMLLRVFKDGVIVFVIDFCVSVFGGIVFDDLVLLLFVCLCDVFGMFGRVVDVMDSKCNSLFVMVMFFCIIGLLSVIKSCLIGDVENLCFFLEGELVVEDISECVEFVFVVFLFFFLVLVVFNFRRIF